MIRDTHDMLERERLAHEAKWGKYNDFPPGWREISMEDFAKSAHFTFAPVIRDYRQMFKRAPDGSIVNEPCVSATLEFQPDGETGFALVSDYWAGKVRFFKFGCAATGHGMNNFKCPACGFHPHYDSSD